MAVVTSNVPFAARRLQTTTDFVPIAVRRSVPRISHRASWRASSRRPMSRSGRRAIRCSGWSRLSGRLSRWKIFVKWLFAIPHFFVLSFFNMLVGIIVWIAWFIILFTKRYPESLYKLVLTYMRWTANVNAYVMFQRDEYPPFGEGPYPVRLDLPYPAELSRWMIFIKWLLVIPSIIVYVFVGLALLVALFIAWWAILITGHAAWPLRFHHRR